ncbi:MAG TPA: F0F1 ATP synthase subunit delta [Propionibacteriaceae bacterium]|jgi:F-type H+-transporting ATPase subunit delta|nr:F0F1 ATP synthase subunit delta [Propionibacteriaceae bacterium]
MTTASDTRLSALDTLLDEAYDRSTADAGLVGKVIGAVRRAPSESDMVSLPADLFAVVDAFESSAALRRAVTDPGAPEQSRRQLVHSLLDGKVSRTAADMVADAAAMRWSGGRTFAAALDRQAVRAQLVEADRNGYLEETEDELFRFARTVEANPELRNALADRAVAVTGRQELVEQLLDGKVNDATMALAKRAVRARERTFAHTIEGYVTLAAALKNRVVATVRVAQPLSAEQRERLRRTLSTQVGREVAVQEVIDPSVLGGVRVELGDEVVEGTVAGRLEQARRLFG